MSSLIRWLIGGAMCGLALAFIANMKSGDIVAQLSSGDGNLVAYGVGQIIGYVVVGGVIAGIIWYFRVYRRKKNIP